MKLYVEKRHSAKSNKDFLALVLNLGYATKLINFDICLMSELTELPVSALYGLKVGDTVPIMVDNK